MREKLGLLGCLAALGVLLLCSADTARAVREGLALCAGSVIPALFPFLAVSGLLTALDAGAAPGRGRMLLARVLGCGPRPLPPPLSDPSGMPPGPWCRSAALWCFSWRRCG